MYNPFSLQGKNILITGASSGLGRSIAIEVSKMGASIVITGRNKERLENTYDKLTGSGNYQIVCDLTIKESFNNLCQELPQLDGVVMCAGIPCSTPVKHNSDNFMREIFETNTFANFNLSKFLISKNKINKNGSMIFISSIASNRPYKGNSIYSASKAAINSFANVLALEVAYKEIRVNCISPGIIPTKANDSAFSDEDLAQQNNKIPLGFGKPIAIANGCIYLLSDASEWITGINLNIDGGQLL
jgi:NAD(P)-dependent dehydrogenase (short-subunit alcohol dehydrogenase family)